MSILYKMNPYFTTQCVDTSVFGFVFVYVVTRKKGSKESVFFVPPVRAFSCFVNNLLASND